MSEITAKLIKIMEPVKGESKNGPWKKQEFIFETDGEYPKKICIANWNDKVSPDELIVGKQFKLFINIESREFNDKWYTDVKMWKVEKVGSAASGEETPPYIEDDIPPPTAEDDGLPF